MKPETKLRATLAGIGYAVYGILLLLIVLTALATEAQNKKYRNTFELQEADILELKNDIIRITSICDAVKVLDLFLPQECMRELSIVNHNVKLFKQQEERAKHNEAHKKLKERAKQKED